MPSDVLSGRMPSSAPTTTGSPRRWGTGTGTISSANTPDSVAAAARAWLAAAHSSCSALPIPSSAFLASDCSPIVHWSNEQNSPSCCIESTSSPSPMRSPHRAPGTRYGELDIDSMPPAITNFASPRRM